MKGKILGFALALLSVATVGVVQMNAKAYVDNDPDCDQYAVVNCGTFTLNKIRASFGTGDHAKVFAAFGIQKSEIGGNIKSGTVYQDGRVVVAGKVVARNAIMAARHLGGNPIPGTSAAKLSVSNMGSAQTAFVKFDANGRFMFAIMKPCGNPVVGTPTKPEPKPEAVCKNLSVDKIERTKFRFNATADVKNGAKVKGYVFTVTSGGNTVFTKTIASSKEAESLVHNQTKAGDYKVRVTVKTSEGDRTNADCVKQFTVKEQPSAVCKSLTVSKIERTKFRFDAKATVDGGAKVQSYTFMVKKGDTVVSTKTVTTANLSASMNYTQTVAGNYTVKVSVKTTAGVKNSANCEKPFTVSPPQVTPTAICKAVTVDTLESTKFRFNASAEVTGSATVTGYVFTVYSDNAVISTQTVNTGALSASTEYTQTTPGAYQVKVTVKTSLGDRTSTNCEKTFTVPPTDVPTPGVKIEKFVENVKYTRVGVNVEYDYQIKVTNTGDTDLTNVVVTDTPDQGITLVSADQGTIANNTWTYTIPVLKVGEAMNFTLSAKVPVYLAGMLTNTVCVNAPEVPGNPDDCDTADVDVPTPGKVEVCNPETGEIITVDEQDADKYVPVGSDECKEIKVCVLETKEITIIKKSDFDGKLHTTDLSKCEETPVTPVTPTELPRTGAAQIAMQLIGATSLASAGSYYLMSRRNRA